MKLLLVGAGGVGEAVGAMAGQRGFLDGLVVGDLSVERAQRVAGRAGATPAEAVQLDGQECYR